MKINYNGSMFTVDLSTQELQLTSDGEIVEITRRKNGEDVSEEYIGEYWGQLLNNTKLPSSGIKEKDYTVQNIREDLQFLNARLDYVRKTLTFWDAFQIKQIINNENDLAKLYVLPSNTSAIINSSVPLNWNNMELRRGDIVVNANENGLVRIESQAAGIYEPKITVSGNNTLTITYALNGGMVNENLEPTSIKTDFTSEEVYYNIEENLKIVNNIITIDSFDAIVTEENKLLQPVVLFFIESNTESNAEWEEIKLNYTLLLNDNDKYTLIVNHENISKTKDASGNETLSLPITIKCRIK